MSRRDAPRWLDRQGMAAWCRGVAALLNARVAILDLEGSVLVEEGRGDGASRRFPFQVNGEPAGAVEIMSRDPAAGDEAVIGRALEALERLADLRNTMADLVQTTAHQWRELSLLYKFTDALSGALDPAVLARHLADRAHRVFHARSTAVCFRPPEPGEGAVDCRFAGEPCEAAEAAARWGMELEAGALYSGTDEISGLDGGPGAAPGGVMVVPLRARATNYGVLSVIREEDNPFTAEDLKLANLLAHQTALAFANIQLIGQVRRSERIRRELEMAAEIQASILPPPVTRTGSLTVVASCTPAQEVGGDAYIVLPLEGGLLAGVADVAGHGLSSALLMNAFASEIQALSLTETRPGALLDATNRLISQRVGDMSLFVTVILIRCWEDGSLSLASAGHPPPMVLGTDGGLEVIDVGGLPLGVMEDETYEEVRLEAGRYNVVVAYSDGLTEARDATGGMFGLGRLEGLLRDLAGKRPGPEEVHAAILEDLESFSGGAAQPDDLTVVALGRSS